LPPTPDEAPLPPDEPDDAAPSPLDAPPPVDEPAPTTPDAPKKAPKAAPKNDELDPKDGHVKPPEAAPEDPAPAKGARPRAGLRTLPVDLTDLPDVATTIGEAARYDELFVAAFGSSSVTPTRLATAIADYCRSLRSTESAVDRYLEGEREALSEAARRGLALFKGRAGCAQCHSLDGAHPALSDYEFHNTGVVWRTLNRGVLPGEPEVAVEDVVYADRGREAVSRAAPDRRAFKTPTLRDVTRRGPYMHDGSIATLAGVVRHYAAGGAPSDERQDPRVKPFEASAGDVADLVAFLEALEGDELPGRARRAWHRRPEVQRVRLVDARGGALAGLPITLTPEGDRLPVADPERSLPVELYTDEEGWFECAPSCCTHLRVGLPDGLVLVGGPLLPDTLTTATLRVPVSGRVQVLVRFASGLAAPPLLAAEHEGTMRLPGHEAPRTVLRRTENLEPVDGCEVARYEGWKRTDVPPDVIVRVPGDLRPQVDHRLRLTSGRVLRLFVGW
jgi:hypothetical protein